MTNQTHTVSDRAQMLIWVAVGFVVLGAVFVSIYIGS
jgi:hypothetical protein